MKQITVEVPDGLVIDTHRCFGCTQPGGCVLVATTTDERVAIPAFCPFSGMRRNWRLFSFPEKQITVDIPGELATRIDDAIARNLAESEEDAIVKALTFYFGGERV